MKIFSLTFFLLAILSMPLFAQNKEWKKPDEKKLKSKLTQMQYDVTQKGATEPPFKNAYYNEKRPGIYVDVTTGEPLFSSLDKFDSGTGWPSFTKGINDSALSTKLDLALGTSRTEVIAQNSKSHLGHVFDDGPADKGGKRFCINSSALNFIPLEQMEAKGYKEFLKLFDGAQSVNLKKEIAYFAGGCFWGMEEIIRNIPGVLVTQVGYTGGDKANPSYEIVKKGNSGHAESVKVEFDPTKISYTELLGYFFRMHDPTTLNQQGNDKGSQYRSAIFYVNEEQKKIASSVKQKVDQSKKWKSPIVTQIVPFVKFYPAEEYHQRYLQRFPKGYTCHFLRD
ncbi:MAG: bifunctional methionine sulfoxide reductase B/A protein [Bacteriovoracaceae bacterium]|nr:bifunctional methionine sulfoxide reductase B/A protein [Bacteriovoracaceae bacterium]